MIDEDPIFRLGLITWLGNQSPWQIVGQVGSPGEAQGWLKEPYPDLILLDPLMLSNPGAGWQFCQQLCRDYPTLKVCLLTASLDRLQLQLAQRRGVAGYFPKGIHPPELLTGLECILQGETVWSEALVTRPVSLNRRDRWLLSLFHSGLTQIDSSLDHIETHLRQGKQSEFDQLFWQGRKRELFLARWLVRKAMPSTLETALEDLTNPSDSQAPQTAAPSAPSSAIAPVNVNALNNPLNSALSPYSITALGLEAGRNLTDIPLELDILQSDKRQALIALVVQQIQNVVQDLKTLAVTPEQLPHNGQYLLGEIWQTVTLTFLSQYGHPATDYPLDQLQALLTVYRPIIQQESLDKIPLTEDIFRALLFTKTGESLLTPPTDLEAIAEPLGLYFQNLIIHLANSTMVFVLNYFASQEDLKQGLCQSSFLSSRAMANFRNNLAWRYRYQQYWLEPRCIFESRHQLWYFTPQGLQITSVYYPRQQELTQLTGIPWLVTILWELRDAVAPRLRSLVKFLGNGLIFLLTQVVGRAIGLIIKGIFQGIGNSWPERRYPPSRS